MRLLTQSLMALALLLPILGANAQPARFVEGTHYEVIDSPVRTADANKIEVAEVFWYGCPHCYAFEPLIENWKEQLADDVMFVYSPGMWNGLMEVHAKIYYVAEAMDMLDSVHPAAFTEIHQRGNYLETDAAVRDLFLAHGADGEAFDRNWRAFGINSKVKQAGSRMRDYGVRGVPNLIVNGKYRISANNAVTTQQDMLRVADYLIEQERQAR